MSKRTQSLCHSIVEKDFFEALKLSVARSSPGARRVFLAPL
jgi:hypothetical protein